MSAPSLLGGQVAELEAGDKIITEAKPMDIHSVWSDCAAALNNL